MKMKRLFAWILTLAMLVTMLPSFGLTAAAASTKPPIVLKKDFIETEPGMPNELRLEAYVTGSLEKTSGAVPADIILVLDQSGSMDDNITSDGVTKSKLAIMKEAVTAFADKVAELNTGGDGSDYRVAIVGFGSEDTNTEVLTTDPIRTYSWFRNNANFEYIPVSSALDEDETYYIASGFGYEEIEYYEYLVIGTDGWYTDGGVWGGGDLVDVTQTTVYERYAHPSTEYANAFVNCTSAAVAEDGAITDAIDALDGNGATRTDLGMEMADDIFLTQPAGTYTDRKKIVVVLTDGVPTTSNTFSATVANNAIEYAKEMKDNGAEIFALYFGNPSDDSKNFMQGLSSNYPNATAYTNLGTQEKTTYYSAHNNASAITSVFNDIVYSIAANAQLDEEAILQDELTKYFKLPDLLPGDIKDEIRVYTADKTATGWGPEVLFEDAIVEISADNKTISVKGFDYAYYCVTEESKSETAEDYGKKLIVYIPIIADETADTIGGYLPTNVHAGVYENDIAEEIKSPEITANGHNDDVEMSYMMENDEIFKHIGTESSYEFAFTPENMDAVLDEMFLVTPDGKNNTGVRLDYRIYDTNADQSSGSDDTLVATLEVNAKGTTDITDINNWDFEPGMDKATITIPSGANSASKVYAIVCRAYNINPAYEQNPVYNMTYGLLNVTVVNNTVHIVGGVIDDGGTIEVPLPSPGTITYDMENKPVGYTEEVAENGSSTKMTFKLKPGYEFRSIIEKKSKDGGTLNDSTELYNKDTNPTGVTFEANGDYVYPSTTVTGGQIVEVYTQLKTFNLTTASDANSLIVDGRTYEYSDEPLAVPFSAKEGYEITSILWGKTKVEAENRGNILGLSPAELAALGIELKKTSEADGYDAVGASEKDLIQGEVRVPRTDDNYVEVTAAARNYKLTYKQYKRVVDDLVTTYAPYGTDVTHIVEYNKNIPSAPVAPGAEGEIEGDNYTVSDWYRYHPNNEFTGLTDVATTLMPAEDMTLHAYWVKNPSIEVSIPVKKTAQGLTGNADFEILGTYHEHPVGDVTLSVSDTTPSATGTLTMKLTDKQYDSFMQGDVIRITESDEAGGNWIYDATEYTVSYNEFEPNKPIIKKGDTTVSVAEFTNYYNAYTVNYDLDGGKYNGADSIDSKEDVKYNDERLIPDDAPVKDNFRFIGWKYNATDVTRHTTYAALAGSPSVYFITLVAQYESLTTPIVPSTKVLYIVEHYRADNDGVYPNTPNDTERFSDEIGKTVTAVPKTDGDYEDYCVNLVVSEPTMSEKLKAITKPEDIVTLKLYYDIDVIGTPDPDDGDGVADIFQKKIIFKVVNGTWANDTSADIVAVVDLLDGNGKYSKTGEADISALIPTGMKANSGYRNGRWDVIPETPAKGAEAVTYTHSFERSGGGGGGGVTRYTLTYETNGGSSIAKETYTTGTTVKLTKTPTKDGYVFEGWYEDKELTKSVEEVKMTKNITVYAKWVEDNGSAGSGYHTPDSLNGEDHFAYVIGYPDGTVRPNDHITRAEVTAIFFRLLKPDEIRDKNLTSENSFTDVNAEDWHNTSVSTMAKLGIVKGRTAKLFAPDADITRAEFAAICARFDDSEFEVVDDFKDVKGHWAEADIHEAAAHGWIKGYEDHTFKPDQPITRAEAMTMINRVLNRVPETADDLLADMIKWPDNADTSVWYYLPVQEATNSHDYDIKNHIYEKWTSLKQGTDWTKYEK